MSQSDSSNAPDMAVFDAVEAYRSVDGLVASYSLEDDDDTEFINDDERNQPLTLTGDIVERVPGRVTSNSGASGAIPDVQAATAASGQWTIDTWIELIDSRDITVFASGEVSLVLDGSSASARAIIRGPGNVQLLTVNDVVADGLYHIVTTYDGAIVRLYVNGFLAGAAITSDMPLGDSLTWGESLRGALEHLAIYDRALTRGEIAAHTVVGPDPTADDLQEERGDLFYSQQSEFEVYRAIDVADLTIGPMQSSPDWLDLNAERRALQRLAIAAPPPRSAFLHASYRHVTNDLSNGATIQLWRMRQGWSGSATWTKRNSVDDWQSPGAEGENDRDPVPIGTATVDWGSDMTPDRTVLLFDVTEVARDWLADEETQFGWMLTSNTTATDDGDTRSVESDDGIAARPSILLLGSAEALPDAPESVSSLEAIPLDSGDIQVRWQGDGPLFEVYGAGQLRALMSRSTFEVNTPSEAVSYTVYSVDDFGQRSAAASVTVTP